MQDILQELTNTQNLIKITLSSPKQGDFKKIIVRPIENKNSIKWQFEKYQDSKVFHENINENELQAKFSSLYKNFKQIVFFYTGKTCTYSFKKGNYHKTTTTNNMTPTPLTHNRQKQYILNEGTPIPALIDLGIFNSNYEIIKSKFDKFKQINRFIEIIDDAFKTTNKDEITILDFGCGKSYLTFIVYYYFTYIKNIKATIIGYDLKADVVENCNKIATKYGYNNLKFFVNDVTNDKLFEGNIDMIITLHACDIATDYALFFAIKNNVKNIFSVPCCQHEINNSISKGGDYDILLKHGLIKERFSALLTDSIRAEILHESGYHVDVLEFVDFTHSPKNLMLRATKVAKSFKPNFDIEKLTKQYKFNQILYNLIKAQNNE